VDPNALTPRNRPKKQSGVFSVSGHQGEPPLPESEWLRGHPPVGAPPFGRCGEVRPFWKPGKDLSPTCPQIEHRPGESGQVDCHFDVVPRQRCDRQTAAESTRSPSLRLAPKMLQPRANRTRPRPMLPRSGMRTRELREASCLWIPDPGRDHTVHVVLFLDLSGSSQRLIYCFVEHRNNL
jgi:hypothetical protein